MRLNQILVLFFISTLTLPAQILNIEKSRIEVDTGDYFRFNTTLSLSSFNRSADVENPVNLFGFNAQFNAIRKKGKHALILINQTDYLRINENPFLNTGFTHIRGHFWRESKRSLEIYTQYSYDNFRQMNPRILFGTNARLAIVKNKKVSLYFGGGPVFEWERWTHPQTDEVINVEFLKLNTYTSFRASINENIDFNTLIYYQVGYDESITDFRHRVALTSNIITKITQRLSLNIGFEIQYEDKPIVPITPLIYSIRNGLSYSF
ncbi:MAG: DUF481 domain-containing protein [Cryomorphaceae bacterium]|nr:DUF481 domain-containing protein [Cryomorphaceae bacterium]